MIRDGGIHKHVNKLVFIAGGYDAKYHAKKLADQYKLSEEFIYKLLSTRGVDGYLNAYLERQRTEEEIHELIDRLNKESIQRLKTIYGVIKDNVDQTSFTELCRACKELYVNG